MDKEGGGLQSLLRFDIEGMHCAACSSRIERVGQRLPHVKRLDVNLATKSARIWTEPGCEEAATREFEEAVRKLGFTASPATEEDVAEQYAATRESAIRDRRARLWRLLPMCAFCLPLLVLSMGHMLGIDLPTWLEPHSSPRIFMLVQLVLTMPVVWLGRHFYIQGLAALWRRSPNMDSLVAVGTGAAFIYSLWNTLAGLMGFDPVQHAMNLYYESCAVLLTMIELGQFLEAGARSRAGDAMGALLSLAPETAVRLEGEGSSASPREVPIQAVRRGDRLVVRPGSRVPVDGEILEGRSAVDLSLLTGESIPVAVGPGDSLVAGSVNGEGSLLMRALAVGANTRLARIIRLVREAQGSKAPIARLADRVSFYFVPAVMLLAVLSALAWLCFSSAPFTVAVNVFVAVLVMACPCAMGLATPMSIMVGTGRGAQLGVIIKNGAALEQAGKISCLAVDKTGTLTEGRPELTAIYPLEGKSGPAALLDESSLLALVASLEGRSEHPLGLAIVREAKARSCPACQVENVSVSPGLGISGDVSLAGRQWHVGVGNQAFMLEKGIQPDAAVQSRLRELAAAGQTPLLVSVGPKDGSGPAQGELAAIFALADALRPESARVVAQLRKMGIGIVMLSGDNEQTARAIASRAGIDEVAAGLLPAQKADYIKSLQDSGEIVGMVGDGLNDAPALALANVGMAVGSGVDVSAEAGDIILMRGGMAAVITSLALSRATMLNIRENLGWAFGYNILGLPVAAGLLYAFGGPMLSPMFAGLAMALSSFSVVSNALRLRWFNLEKTLA